MGNVRVAFKDNGSGYPVALQRTDYYPFGMVMNQSGPSANKYLYNGKERMKEPYVVGMDWYDYGFRMYDPQLGRWHVMDPKAEKYISITPYAYVGNNPISRIDPNGMEWSEQAEREAERMKRQTINKNENLAKQNQRLAERHTNATLKGKTEKAERIANKMADNEARQNVNDKTIAAIDIIGDVKGIKFEFGNKYSTVNNGDGTVTKTAILARKEDGTYVINNSGFASKVHETIHGKQVAESKFKLGPGSDRKIWQAEGVTNVDLETEAYKAQYGVAGELPYEVEGIEDKDFRNKTEEFMNKI